MEVSGSTYRYLCLCVNISVAACLCIVGGDVSYRAARGEQTMCAGSILVIQKDVNIGTGKYMILYDIT